MGDDLSLELQILDGIRQMGEMQANNPDVQTCLEQRACPGAGQVPVRPFPREPAGGSGRTHTPDPQKRTSPDLDLSASFVPGICVLFVFLSSTSVARSLFDERKSGTLRRLMSAPLSRATLLAGKMVPIFLLTLIQIIVIFAVGAFLLPVMGFGHLAVGQ